MITAVDTLDRVLRVCHESGYRKGGIFKAMDENRNLYRVLRQYPRLFDKFPWIDGCMEGHDLFLENLLAALLPTFPDAGKYVCRSALWPQKWPGKDYSRNLTRFSVKDAQDKEACVDRVLTVCGDQREGLARRLEQNRRLLMTLFDADGFFKHGPFCVESWIELLEVFFMDLLRAIGRVAEDPSPPWPGHNYTEFLMVFDNQPDAAIFHKHCEDMQAEKL